ncbi:MAG: hypothetical protein HKN56_06765 [Gammaproteobacteria bacterium]|nr:hypothetical protein [Gammaproteobacteria bacterium]
MKELLLVLVFLAAVAWLIARVRDGKNDAQASRAKPPSRSSRYHAVSVKYSSTACDAAKAMTGLRVLSADAPRLPLPECNAEECRCGFAHHDDRRSGEDRRNPYGSRSAYGAMAGSIRTERRGRKDRRQRVAASY